MTPRTARVLLILFLVVPGCRLEQVNRAAPPPDSARRAGLSSGTVTPPPAGAHLLGLRGTSHVATDLDSAAAWYQAVTGIAPSVDEPTQVEFAIGGFALRITPVEGDMAAPGTSIAYWGVANIDSTWQRLLDLGAVVHEPIRDVGGGVRRGAVRDPFGNLFGVVQDHGFRVGW